MINTRPQAYISRYSVPPHCTMYQGTLMTLVPFRNYSVQFGLPFISHCSLVRQGLEGQCFCHISNFIPAMWHHLLDPSTRNDGLVPFISLTRSHTYEPHA